MSDLADAGVRLEALAELLQIHADGLGSYLRRVQGLANHYGMSVEDLLTDKRNAGLEQAYAAPTYHEFLALMALLAELEG